MHNPKESVLSTIVYNMDCLEAMKQFEDNHFDLAIVDPPYGSGLGEGGGCQGRFAKYREDNQPRNNAGGGNSNTGTGSVNDSTDTNIKRISRGGLPRQALQSRFTIKEQTPNGTDNGSSPNGRSTKPKKLFRGMLRLNRNTLMNCFASHVIRSYGVATISVYHLQDAF